MSISHENLDQCILCGSKDIVLYDSQTSVWQCTSCKLFFDNPRPTLETIAEYYSRKGKYDAWLTEEPALDKDRMMFIQRFLKYQPGGELLDIGAGIGQFLNLAKKYYSCTGTEISSEGIDIAKNKYGVNVIQGEVESVDFHNKKFDVITIIHVLEHLPFPGKTLRFCSSLLNPGGILYIGVPNEAAYSLRVVLPMLFSKLGLKKYARFSKHGFRKIDTNLEEIHLSHFSEPILKNFLKQNDFTIVDSGIDFLDPFHFSKGLIQIPRHMLYFASKLLYAVTGINTYNSLWIVAKKN